MELTQKVKAQIDAMTMEQLAARWQKDWFPTDPDYELFQGESYKYIFNRMMGRSTNNDKKW